MPTSPLRHEVRMNPRERIPPIPFTPLVLDYPGSIWSSNPTTPTTPTSPGSSFPSSITRKPLAAPKIPTSKYATSNNEASAADMSMIRGQSFSSECSSAPSMVADSGSEESDMERDDDPYHENVAKEWDAWHVDEPVAPRHQYRSVERDLPQAPPTTPMPPLPQQHRQHRTLKSESSTNLCDASQPSRPRAATFMSNSTVRQETVKNSGPPPRPTRPSPIPTPQHFGTFPPPVPPKPKYPPPPPPTPSSPTYQYQSQSQYGARPQSRQHHTLPRRAIRTPLSLYPSTTAHSGQGHPQIRPCRSTPQLRPIVSSTSFPSLPPTPTHFLYHHPLPATPTGAQLEKSVFELDDDSGDEDEGEREGGLSNSILAGVAKKFHARSASGGSGTGSRLGDGGLRGERRGSDTSLFVGEEKKEGNGGKLRRTAGSFVRGLFGSGRRGSAS